MGFLQDSQPVIEGQLKEKKGRWKIFKRWRTRYFTLSGAHLSYKGSVSYILLKDYCVCSFDESELTVISNL